MRLHKYSLVFDNVFDVRIKLHWSILPAMVLFGGMKVELVYFLSFFLLILIHEIGHALVVKAYSYRNHELILHGLGGACIWSGSATQKQISIISWGGVLAQLIVFIIFLIIPKIFSFPPNDFLDQIFRAFIGTNLFIMIINLIPYEPLDGAEAWKLFDPIWKDMKSLKNKQKYRSSDETVQNQINKIFKENAKSPNKRV